MAEPGPLVVDDEAEVGLVEAHPERDRGDERLDLVGEQRVLERLALARSSGRRCRRWASMPCERSQRGHALGVGDGQAVDDAAPRHAREVLGEPGQPLRLVASDDRIELQASRRASGPRMTVDALAELVGDVRDHPIVGGCGRGQDRHARIEQRCRSRPMRR